MIQSGVIRATPQSLRGPKQGWKGEPNRGDEEVSEWDLASGMDCDIHEWSAQMEVNWMDGGKLDGLRQKNDV